VLSIPKRLTFMMLGGALACSSPAGPPDAAAPADARPVSDAVAGDAEGPADADSDAALDAAPEDYACIPDLQYDSGIAGFDAGCYPYLVVVNPVCPAGCRVVA
jgi:hypothetical protein